MQNFVLIVHLILALCLIAAVLLQRSEGGALGIGGGGGGGGGGGLVSSRGAATALSKLTWVLATAFICTSILLTILAGGGQTGSVIDQLNQPTGDAALDQLLPSLPAAPPAADDGGAAPAPAPTGGGLAPSAPPQAE